jgi:hypothetical protein
LPYIPLKQKQYRLVSKNITKYDPFHAYHVIERECTFTFT